MEHVDVASKHAVSGTDRNGTVSADRRDLLTDEALTIRVSGCCPADAAVARFFDRTRWVDALSSFNGLQAQFEVLMEGGVARALNCSDG